MLSSQKKLWLFSLNFSDVVVKMTTEQQGRERDMKHPYSCAQLAERECTVNTKWLNQGVKGALRRSCTLLINRGCDTRYAKTYICIGTFKRQGNKLDAEIGMYENMKSQLVHWMLR